MMGEKVSQEKNELVKEWLVVKMKEENNRILAELEKLNAQQHATHLPTQLMRKGLKDELNKSIKNVSMDMITQFMALKFIFALVQHSSSTSTRR